jgi:hypothetical protein
MDGAPASSGSAPKAGRQFDPNAKIPIRNRIIAIVFLSRTSFVFRRAGEETRRDLSVRFAMGTCR